MIIIPAVDIKNGKCVRLIQGRQEDETVFSNDPAAMAQKWAKAGAELIHVVDLDGAFEKSPQNLDAIKNILNTVATPIQLGGGIRNEQTVMTLLDMGCATGDYRNGSHQESGVGDANRAAFSRSSGGRH